MLYPFESTLRYVKRRVAGYLNNPFKGIPEKPLWRSQLECLPRPDNRYVIFFTPRSGSSRLTDILTGTGVLGKPGESFNPSYISRMATSYGAQSLEDYVHLRMRHRSTQGTFGCKITSHQLSHIFFSEQRFFRIYEPTAAIFLIRENILEQAVSLSRIMQTGVAHSTSLQGSTYDSADFLYIPGQIRSSLDSILHMERQCEQIFAERGIEPLRLGYETLINIDPATYVPVIEEHVGVRPTSSESLQSPHRKLGDRKNIEYASRFKQENKTLVIRIEQKRKETLETLERDTFRLENLSRIKRYAK
jgi:LPS sulfotransferase NodH